MKYLLSVMMALFFWASLQAQESTNAIARAGGDLLSQTPEDELLQMPAPRLPDGKPDFSGIWVDTGSHRNITVGLVEGEELVLLPEAKALMDSRMQKDDPEANCLPTGIPRIAPFPWRIVGAPMSGEVTHLYFLFEGNIHSYRQIFMDGREHPEDPDPSWYGHSIGHWEGDVLVIDTVGFNDRFWFDFAGHPHTEQLHTIERYERVNYGTLRKTVTIIDPGAYEKPFTVSFDSTLRPGWDIMEYICNENNQDVEHIVGPAGQGGNQAGRL
tara:strand:+ start:2781 stop:3590 length:810 start_codon:yes stop_codon:yes gene_type:complete